MKVLALALALLPACTAFVPAAHGAPMRTVRMAADEAPEAAPAEAEAAAEEPAPAPVPVVKAINGWTPDSKVCWTDDCATHASLQWRPPASVGRLRYPRISAASIPQPLSSPNAPISPRNVSTTTGVRVRPSGLARPREELRPGGLRAGRVPRGYEDVPRGGGDARARLDARRARLPRAGASALPLRRSRQGVCA
jgi:hypothetical protein